MYMSNQNFYIAFEGPIAAGKTTLARRFAAQVGAELLLEDYEGNPFLADYYSERERWALPMQLSFLAARHQQLMAVPVQRTGPVVADHTYTKDQIFAHALLKDRELALYERLRQSLSGQAIAPDVIVYLDAPNRNLLERIRQRGRAYEESIDDDYLDRVRAAYEKELLPVRRNGIVLIDTSTLDLNSSTAVAEVFARIEAGIRGEKIA
jgi:deoxyguanosine kinase